MMSIVILFWMFVILFAIVGWMRGWAKELLVCVQRDPCPGAQPCVAPVHPDGPKSSPKQMCLSSGCGRSS